MIRILLTLLLAYSLVGTAWGLEREPAKDQLPDGRVFQELEDQLAVSVEGRRAAHDRHHAVGARELEEGFDVGIAHAMRDQAQLDLRLELRREPLAP